MRISDWSSDVCSSDLTSCSIIPEAIHHPWELSLPGPWPDVHGAHLTYRASEDSQANGHGGPTTSLRRDAIPFLVMPDWFRHPTLHERWRPRHIGPRNDSGVTKIEGAGDIGRASCRERVCQNV